MNNAKVLTDEKYWHENFATITPHKFGETIYSKILKKYLPVNESFKCIEIGAYPGDILGWMCKYFKYSPVALDFLPEIKALQPLFDFNEIKNLKIINADFLKWNNLISYEVVSSFGFVEHFENYSNIINKHIEILKDNGYLVIGVPYLGYFQLWIRKFFYKKQRLDEVLRIHNRKIMNLNELKRIIENKKMNVVFAGYVGEMDVWFNTSQVQNGKIFFFRIVKAFTKVISKLGISSKFISPLILIIAKK